MDSVPLRRGRLLTTAEAAEVATVSVRTIQRAITSRRLVATRLGASVRIAADDLNDFIESSRAVAVVDPVVHRARGGRRGQGRGRDSGLRVAEPPVPDRIIR